MGLQLEDFLYDLPEVSLPTFFTFFHRMNKITHLVLLATSTAHLWPVWAYQWPSTHYDALEAELFEGTAPDTGVVAIRANDCQSRTSHPGASPIAAEWVRFVRSSLLHVCRC